MNVSLLLSFVIASAISPPETPVEPELAPAGVAPAPTEVAPAATESTPTEIAPTETAPASEFDGPPGGYWTVAEAHEREREPLDGEDQLTIGSVLLSLGLIRGAAGAVNIWMASNTDLCPMTQTRGCSGLRNYGWVGVAEGGLMFATGITSLAIGAVRRQRHRRWERGEAVSLMRPSDALDAVDVGPWLIPRSTVRFSDGPALAGAGLRLRFQF